jgi:hypothetical protein
LPPSEKRRAIPRSSLLMVPSSSGLGHHPLKVEARVRIPLGLPVVTLGIAGELLFRIERFDRLP